VGGLPYPFKRGREESREGKDNPDSKRRGGMNCFVGKRNAKNAIRFLRLGLNILLVFGQARDRKPSVGEKKTVFTKGGKRGGKRGKKTEAKKSRGKMHEVVVSEKEARWSGVLKRAMRAVSAVEKPRENRGKKKNQEEVTSEERGGSWERGSYKKKSLKDGCYRSCYSI